MAAHTQVPGYYLQFASDNTAGTCPEALTAFNAANAGFISSYGEDEMTRIVCDRLRDRLAALPDIKCRPTQANGVFVQLSGAQMARLRQAGWVFHTFIGGMARFMCSWATTEEAVDHLAADIAATSSRIDA